MIKTPLSVVRVAAFCLPLALVASCGSESGAPPDSTITVSTSDKKSWEVSAGTCDNLTMNDTYFNIVVKNPSGAPMTGVDIRVSLDLAPGTFITPAPDLPVMYLYDTSDGVNYNVPITTFPYFTNTGSFGTKMLMVRYDLGGCEYGGNLDVFSGSASGSANITVKLAS